MIPITCWLDKNSSVEMTDGYIPVIEWLRLEQNRINVNSKRHAIVEEGKTTYRLVDYAKVKRMPDGILIFGGE